MVVFERLLLILASMLTRKHFGKINSKWARCMPRINKGSKGPYLVVSQCAET